MTPDEARLLRRTRAGRDAYRASFRDCFAAYLEVAHGYSRGGAKAEAERVIAETDRRIEAERGGW